jgi:hypothetical protein
LAIRADDDTGLAKLLHAADHVTRAGRAPIFEINLHGSAFPAREARPWGFVLGVKKRKKPLLKVFF